ncbi:tRNA epoxyqueuosine(34) reductase QueG [Rhodopirellula halodulae]|uniref:tRNA epoxyqueuosine(34) reductase QueG n=1 Tax=Rhodopirellula halodulae TaxID=2894198 RepID=UPI001E5C1188|nr:tRNA epoxyqueuosine(34) reductase QueG [Rhodopirellula sp. JC737]MCC9657945.1 tRNA epoxyqueuosine(34) reductase QueG [Rhodopirellula sp. JC737]
MIEQIRQTALSEGFAAMGIAPAVTSAGFHQLVDWIESGYAGTMDYIDRRREAYRHPSGVLPGAKSIIVLAMNYDSADPKALTELRSDRRNDPSHTSYGRVARYTWSGEDYHDVIHPKLKRIIREIRASIPGANARGIVDTAPLMEREVAVLAGLGWRGKNTLLLNKQLGSYFFLSCILVDVVLPTDQPHEGHHCGTCTACLDACPTDAFPEPGVMDARRCISYLTIEQSELPEESLRSGIGDWLFGCDICQEVCPWNRRPAKRSQEMTGLRQHRREGWGKQSSDGWFELESLFLMDDDEFRHRFRKTPFWRSRRRGMLRNAIIVMGNQPRPEHLGRLFGVLDEDDPILRAAAVWAILQHEDEAAKERLVSYRHRETDPLVVAEFEKK